MRITRYALGWAWLPRGRDGGVVGAFGCGCYEVSGGCGVGGLVVCGWNMVMFPWPVLVGFVTVVWGKRGWCLRLRSELRCRLVVTRLARIMSAAVRAWAVRAAVEVVAVTRVWVIERVASLRTPVKEIWPVDTAVLGGVVVSGWLDAAGRGLAAVAATAAAVAAALRVSWQPVSQAQNSCSTSAGSLERRIGPREGPASVMVDLFSPMVVSEAAQRLG